MNTFSKACMIAALLLPKVSFAISKDLVKCSQSIETLSDIERVVRLSGEASLIKKVESQKIISLVPTIETDTNLFRLGGVWYQGDGNNYYRLADQTNDFGFRIAGGGPNATVLRDRTTYERIVQSLKKDGREVIGSADLQSRAKVFIENAQKSKLNGLYSRIIRDADRKDVLALDRFLSECSPLADDPELAKIGSSFRTQRENLRKTYPSFFEKNKNPNDRTIK